MLPEPTHRLLETPSYSSNILQRNRLLANLSWATLVTQAGAGSGALTTVEHAYNSGKVIFTIPPADVYDRQYKGQVDCIRDGAICTFGPEDIIYEHDGEYPLKVRKTDIVDFRSGKRISDSPIFNGGKSKAKKSTQSNSTQSTETTKTKSTKTTKSKTTKSTKTTQPTTPPVPPKPVPPQPPQPSLDHNQTLVVEAIRAGHTNMDTIANVTKLRIADLFVAVSELEALGIISVSFGNECNLVV